METRVCSRCKNPKSVDEFAWRDRAAGVRRLDCKQCQKASRRINNEKRCLNCEKPFAVYPSNAKKRVYCGMQCQAAHTRESRTCPICNTPFTVYKNSDQEFCSHKCHATSLNNGRFQSGVFQPRKTVSCQKCGKPFEVQNYRSNAKYCSRECRKNQLNLVCEYCGESYQTHIDPRYKSRFCSRQCQDAAKVGTPPHNKALVTYTCEQCGQGFEDAVSTERRFCSKACCDEWKVGKPGTTPQKRVEVQCVKCEKRFEVIESRKLRTKYCSKECMTVPRVERQCLICNKPFRTTAVYNQRYCSRSCKSIAVVQKMATISPTSIEIETYRALDEMRINYTPQFPLGQFVIDALIEDKRIAIECQGDYWHCNPAIYPDGPVNDRQRKAMEKDRRRFEWLRSKGYQVIELWESDIKSVGAKSLLESALKDSLERSRILSPVRV